MVHLFWTSPERAAAPIPSDLQNNVDEWQRLHESFDVKIWSLEAVRELAFDIPGVWDSISACRFPAMQSDIARLVIISKLGGFYSDLKNRPLVSFLNDLANKPCVYVPEHQPTIDDYLNRPSNSFLGGPASHEFYALCLKIVCDNVDQRIPGGVIDVTGNTSIKRAMLRYRSDSRSDFQFVPSVQAWGTKGGQGGWMKRTSASYNSDMKTHWSTRQKSEPLYVT